MCPYYNMHSIYDLNFKNIYQKCSPDEFDY